MGIVGTVAVLPDDESRFRCGHCGNLTRFDVVRTTRVREFWHLDMSGAAVVEEREIMQDDVEQVACRWCSATDRVALVPRPAFGGPDREAPGDGGP